MLSLAQMPNRSTNAEFTTPAPIAFKPLLCPSAFFRLSILFIFCRVVVRWLGGSFAKLGFSLGLCGFANVQPNALDT
jgi:hypothetical protein